MNIQRTAVLALAALGAIAIFMPWSSMPLLGSMSGINTTLGKVALIIFIIPLLISLIGKKNKDLRGGLFYTAFISGILAALVGLFQFYVISSGSSQGRNSLEAIMADNISIDFGLYMAILAGFLLPLFMVLLKSPRTESALKPKTVKRPSEKAVEIKKPVRRKNNPSPKDAQMKEKNSNPVESTNDKKKDMSLKKDFEPSDHSRFMPK